MFKPGDILVTTSAAPGHFKNIRPGSLWKCLKGDVFGGGAIVVVDGSHQKGITTRAGYFLRVPPSVIADILGQAVRTDLQVRLEALENVGPETVAGGPGQATYKVDGVAFEMPIEVARAISKRNPGKLIQKQLAKV